MYKYLQNLHLLSSAITGTPRIVKVDLSKKPRFTDNYIDVPIKELISAMLYYIKHTKDKELYLLDDFTFLLGVKTNNKEELLEVLQNTIDTIKAQIKNE